MIIEPIPAKLELNLELYKGDDLCNDNIWYVMGFCIYWFSNW